jgi:hypothetical protein
VVVFSWGILLSLQNMFNLKYHQYGESHVASLKYLGRVSDSFKTALTCLKSFHFPPIYHFSEFSTVSSNFSLVYGLGNEDKLEQDVVFGNGKIGIFLVAWKNDSQIRLLDIDWVFFFPNG